MREQYIVDSIVKELRNKGYIVSTEIANFHRSADIAVIDNEEKIWIIECKVSDIGKALRQLKTHKLSADMVFIGTMYRNTKQSTLEKIKEAGVGFLYVMPNKSIKILEMPVRSDTWQPARQKLLNRIMEAN